MENSLIEWRVSGEILNELKQGLTSILTDSLIAKILEAQNEYTTLDRNFIEALVRRTKRLLQFIIIK